MRIEDLDKNLKLETSVTEQNITWHDITKPPFTLCGVSYYEDIGFLRMPPHFAKGLNERLQTLNTCTAGGRVRFCTDSDFIAVKVINKKNHSSMAHMPRTGQSSFDVFGGVGTDSKYLFTLGAPANVSEGYEASHALCGENECYTLNFPLYDCVDKVYIALREGANITAAPEYTYKKPVVYYGSSITQGGCAARPGNAYPAIIGRKLDCDHINLGFSGNAKGEPEMAEYIADLDMSVFVMDYDHNAPNPEHLERTHYPFYKIIRDKNPSLPIIFVSSPPKRTDQDKRVEIILKTYDRARKEGDENVYFIDGRHLFDGEMSDGCTVDGCHPTDLGFFRMAQNIGKAVEKVIK